MAETSPTPASSNAPMPPPPAPVPAVAVAPRPAEPAARVVVPIRGLIITLALAMFAACVTFAVGAQIFIVPSLTGQSQAILIMQSQINDLRAEVRSLEEQLSEPAEPAPAEPAAPAVAPAPTPAPAPAK